MKVTLFVGPSISLSTVRQLLPAARLCGPAGCGDIYSAAKTAPAAIGLIDGYFDHRLSVWHKEILWALTNGTRIYGAASMGALRAAELDQFGMIGVGSVFEQYRDGVLEDDDEVAVVHQPEERGYRPISEALVNLRATLTAARTAGALTIEEHAALLAGLKRLFYPQRTLQALRLLMNELLPPAARTRFDSWLERHGVIDRKALDAEQLLQRISQDLQRGLPEPPARFRLERTDAWETLRSKLDHADKASSSADERPRHSIHPGPAGNGDEPPVPGATPADPLKQPGQRLALRARLATLQEQDPDMFAQVMQAAASRALALMLCKRAGTSVDPSSVQRASESFRRQRGLLTPERTATWLEKNHLNLATFSAFIHDSTKIEAFSAAAAEAIEREIPDTLRSLELLDRVLCPNVE